MEYKHICRWFSETAAQHPEKVARLVLLAPAWVAWEMPVVRREGWAPVMPTV